MRLQTWRSGKFGQDGDAVPPDRGEREEGRQAACLQVK